MKLKTRPNDFRVDEILADGYLQKDGDHTVFHVTKKKLTSIQAAEILAREIGIEPSEVSMAGLKDRQGVTTQYMSVPGKKMVKLNDPELKIERVGYASEPYASEHSEGNAFRIRLRDLDARDLGRLRDNLESVRRHGAPNYFDDQRFGNLRHNQGWIAKGLMVGDTEEALKAFVAAPSHFDDPRLGGFKAALRKHWGNWGDCREIAIKFHMHQSLFAHLKREPEDFAGAFHRLSTRLRLIHLFAYQSHIWNRAVALYLAGLAGEGEASVSNAIEGALVFPHAVPDELLEIPLPDERLANIEDPEVHALFERVLEHEGLTVDEFAIDGVPGFQLKGEPRELYVRPSELELDLPDRVDARRGRAMADLAFRLPRGAYATLVVRALLAQPVRGQVDPWRVGARSAYDGEGERERDARPQRGGRGSRGHKGHRGSYRRRDGGNDGGGYRGRDDGGRDDRGQGGGYRGRDDRGQGGGYRGRDDRGQGGGYRGRDDRGQGGGYRGRDDRGQGGGYRGRDDRGQGGGYRGRDDRGQGGGYRGRDDRGQGGGYRGRDDRGQGGGYRGRDDRGQGGGYRGRDDRGQGGGYRGRDDRGRGGGYRGRDDRGQGGGYRGRDDRGRDNRRQGGGDRGRDDRGGRSGGYGGAARGPAGGGGASRGWRHESQGQFKRYVSEDDRRRARGERPRLTGESERERRRPREDDDR